MIGLWVAVAAACLAVAAALAWPLLRRGRPHLAERSAYDLAVWGDQLAEIDRDEERGLIDAAQAEAARIEVKRRILAGTAGEQVRSSRLAPDRSPVLATLMAVAVPAVAVAAYLAIGAPRLPDQPLAARSDRSGASAADRPAEAAALGLDAAIAGLKQRLAVDPRNLEAWLMLARAQLAMENYPEAASALRQAWDLSGRTAAIGARYGEALVRAGAGDVTGEARAAFAAVLAADPRNPRARYYLALARAQDGDIAGALQGWVDLVALAPEGAPWLPQVREQIDRAAADLGIDPAALNPSLDLPAALPSDGTGLPVPTREQAEAAGALPPEQRAAFIQAMVGRLEARLEDDPGDRDGWLRLARAWDVLGEPDKAEAARARAAALDP